MLHSNVCLLLPAIPDSDVMSPLPSGLNTTVSDIIGNVVGGFVQRPIGPMDMILSTSWVSAASRSSMQIPKETSAVGTFHLFQRPVGTMSPPPSAGPCCGVSQECVNRSSIPFPH
jgi:hypothetical protein